MGRPSGPRRRPPPARRHSTAAPARRSAAALRTQLALPNRLPAPAGPEIMSVALQVLDAAGAKEGEKFEYTEVGDAGRLWAVGCNCPAGGG